MAARSHAIAIAGIAVLAGSAWSQEPAIPAGFVRLSVIAPTIRQDIRYAGAFNFTGERVSGYEAAQCILWRPAAEALARAQARLANEGFSLKIYDCYRPARAVRAFVTWSKASGEDRMKPVFYPAIDKARLLALGYIAPRSTHSRGIAVDVGLARADEPDGPSPTQGGRCDGPFEERAKESRVDLGTAFDCFSELSRTAYPRISAEARANRTRLLRALRAEGFHNYSREWWHFEFNGPSLPRTAYDFPVR